MFAAFHNNYDLTEGFLRYDFGGLIFGRGLYMEGLIFGILRYSTHVIPASG